MEKKIANYRQTMSHSPQPLSVAFPTPSALAVLRSLNRAQADMSLRSLARVARISHRTCALVLRALERYHLAERIQVGKSLIVRLNRGNAIISELVLPLLDREREMVEDIEGSIHRQFGGLCRKMIMRGVTAGQGEVDLIAEPSQLGRVKALAREMEAGLEERYGFDIQFRVFTYDDAPLELVIG